MNLQNIKHELQNILRGESQDSQSALIQSIAGYLRKSQETSTMAEGNKHDKTEETKKLIQYINEEQLWNCDVDFLKVGPKIIGNLTLSFWQCFKKMPKRDVLKVFFVILFGDLLLAMFQRKIGVFKLFGPG